MATTISNEYGTFTGETEAEALKLAKKGKREWEKRARELDAIKAVALTRAEACGFRVLSLALGNGIPKGWAVEEAKAPGTFGPLWACGTDDEGNEVHEVETVDGRGKFATRRGTVRGVVVNVFRFAVAVIARSHSREEYVYAVGTHEGVAELTKIPTLTLDAFRKRCSGSDLKPASLEAVAG